MPTITDFSQLKTVWNGQNSRNLNMEPILEVHKGDMLKYLEKYACKNEQDLSDTLWYSYGVFLRVLE